MPEIMLKSSNQKELERSRKATTTTKVPLRPILRRTCVCACVRAVCVWCVCLRDRQIDRLRCVLTVIYQVNGLERMCTLYHLL